MAHASYATDSEAAEQRRKQELESWLQPVRVAETQLGPGADIIALKFILRLENQGHQFSPRVDVERAVDFAHVVVDGVRADFQFVGGILFRKAIDQVQQDASLRP